MLARLAVLLVVCCAAVAAYAQDDAVDWRDAAGCAGRVCSLRGTVVDWEPAPATIRLYFDTNRTVRILLMRGWLVTWPAYVGQTIVATGKVQRFQEHIDMIVVDPSNITVFGPLPTATAASPPASPSAPAGPTPTSGEVEELRQRVRELEQHIKDLEGR